MRPPGNSQRTIRLDLVRSMRSSVLEMGGQRSELDELDAAAHGAFRRDPARSLDNLAYWLADHGRRDRALAEVAEARAAVLSLKDVIIRRSGLDEWRVLWSGVQKEGERAREIRKTRERFATVAQAVHRPQRPR